MKKRIVLLFGFGVLAAMSCAPSVNNRVGRATPTAATMTTGARVLMNDDAAMVMTNARCEHESACDNVGEAKRFADHDACRRALFPNSIGVVRAEMCPAGVDEDKLAACLAGVRDQSCGAALPRACRREQLCVAQ